MEPIYQLEGVVLRGKRIGRTLGVPTANLPLPRGRDVPENGIYIAQVLFPGEPGRLEPAVLSQGVHPTLPEGEPTVEVFLLSCSEDLYDQPIRVQYLAYIRPEIKFDSREALRERMQQDIREARAYFGVGG
ncbi:MAG: riboflavin kinase [Christensenellales bacterium]